MKQNSKFSYSHWEDVGPIDEEEELSADHTSKNQDYNDMDTPTPPKKTHNNLSIKNLKPDSKALLPNLVGENNSKYFIDTLNNCNNSYLRSEAKSPDYQLDQQEMLKVNRSGEINKIINNNRGGLKKKTFSECTQKFEHNTETNNKYERRLSRR